MPSRHLFIGFLLVLFTGSCSPTNTPEPVTRTTSIPVKTPTETAEPTSRANSGSSSTPLENPKNSATGRAKYGDEPEVVVVRAEMSFAPEPSSYRVVEFYSSEDRVGSVSFDFDETLRPRKVRVDIRGPRTEIQGVVVNPVFSKDYSPEENVQEYEQFLDTFKVEGESLSFETTGKDTDEERGDIPVEWDIKAIQITASF